jgi:uncharacterized protein YyaL (SSP411 family)
VLFRSDATKKTLIYICVDGACQLPVTDINKAWNQIKINY